MSQLTWIEFLPSDLGEAVLLPCVTEPPKFAELLPLSCSRCPHTSGGYVARSRRQHGAVGISGNGIARSDGSLHELRVPIGTHRFCALAAATWERQERHRQELPKSSCNSTARRFSSSVHRCVSSRAPRTARSGFSTTGKSAKSAATYLEKWTVTPHVTRDALQWNLLGLGRGPEIVRSDTRTKAVDSMQMPRYKERLVAEDTVAR